MNKTVPGTVFILSHQAAMKTVPGTVSFSYSFEIKRLLFSGKNHDWLDGDGVKMR
jgi:hypothetical protein